MEFPVIISFYSLGTPYEKEVQNLIASCAKFNLSTSIEGMESCGSWELNCAYKPFFILKKLEELNRPILWVDADAVFVQEPVWQQAFEKDFAAYLDPTLPDEDDSKVLSGTLFARPSAKPLIREWIRQCHRELLDINRDKEFWDQIALRDVLLKSPKNSFDSLPNSYVKIFDAPNFLGAKDSVIVHYQASRRLKTAINSK